MQFEAQGPEPLGDASPKRSSLFLVVTVDDHVIRVALERTARMLPSRPAIERVVHEQVGQQRRDRRPLWGPLVPHDQGPVADVFLERLQCPPRAPDQRNA